MVPELLLCDFHDARIASIKMVLPQCVVIEFSEINCYYKTNDSRIADIWVCQASLSISRAKQVDLSLRINENLLINNADFTFEEGESDKYNIQLLGGVNCNQSRIVFESGDVLSISKGHVTLAINSRSRFLESYEWSD